jgi:hypothetical protein
VDLRYPLRNDQDLPTPTARSPIDVILKAARRDERATRERFPGFANREAQPFGRTYDFPVGVGDRPRRGSG